MRGSAGSGPLPRTRSPGRSGPHTSGHRLRRQNLDAVDAFFEEIAGVAVCVDVRLAMFTATVVPYRSSTRLSLTIRFGSGRGVHETVIFSATYPSSVSGDFSGEPRE